MKYLIGVLMVFALVGCEPQSDAERASKANAKAHTVFNEVCMQGVAYYFAAFGNKIAMAPVFKPDSSVKTCGQ